MGNTAGGKRRNSGDPLGSPIQDGGFEFPQRRLLYQPSSEDNDDFLQRHLKAELQDSQYEPVTSLRGQNDRTRPSKLPTVFKWEGGGKEVFLSGSFTGWKTNLPMVKSHQNFYTIVELPQGEHQYKFLVDGEWVHDPSEPSSANNLGGLNNIMEVKSSDFEVFEALAADSIASRGSGTNYDKTSLSGSPPGGYAQVVPARKQERGGGPPLLPPHLLQVILNKDIPIHCEPTLLPEPNHVMLNHLYALSIKDGVMVLSATHRYRKKYVTTLLYKPI